MVRRVAAASLRQWCNHCHQSCIQGGFIWDWVDQGLLHEVKDANGKAVEAWGYGGDFGGSLCTTPNLTSMASSGPTVSHTQGAGSAKRSW